MIKIRFVMLLTNHSDRNDGSQLNKYYNNALPRNHIILLVHKIGFSFVSLLYSIIQKWNVIISLHSDKLNYEFCTYNNK
jgi:hypothetical protein